MREKFSLTFFSKIQQKKNSEKIFPHKKLFLSTPNSILSGPKINFLVLNLSKHFGAR